MRLIALALVTALVAGTGACASSDFSGSSATAKKDPEKKKDGGSGAAKDDGKSGDAKPSPDKDKGKDQDKDKSKEKPGDGAKDGSDDGSKALDGENGDGDGSKAVTPDPPPAEPVDDPLEAVDANCVNPAKVGGLFGGGIPLAPPQSALPKVAPADCRTGIEFNNFYGKFTLPASSADGSRSLTLEVDIATYRAPDRVRIVAITKDGSERVIVDSCRLSTANYMDPTGGSRRPPDDALRYFHAPIPKGTKELSFDYGGTSSPTYIRVIGLCDFNVGAPKVVNGGTPPLRTVSD